MRGSSSTHQAAGVARSDAASSFPHRSFPQSPILQLSTKEGFNPLLTLYSCATDHNKRQKEQEAFVLLRSF